MFPERFREYGTGVHSLQRQCMKKVYKIRIHGFHLPLAYLAQSGRRRTSAIVVCLFRVTYESTFRNFFQQLTFIVFTSGSIESSHDACAGE